MLSHGSGCNIDGLGWLAGALAQNGALVLADPNFAPHIDPERIYSIGFSTGDANTLQLAGSRGDIGAFKAYCTGPGVRHLGCAYFAAGGVNYDTIAVKEFNQELREARISRTVVVDPGLARAFTDTSIAALNHPMLLIALGRKSAEEAGIDVGPNGSGLSDRIKDARFHALTPASHFSFLDLCTRDAVEILKAEGEEQLCNPEDTAIRALVHQKAISLISEFLSLN